MPDKKSARRGGIRVAGRKDGRRDRDDDQTREPDRHHLGYQPRQRLILFLEVGIQRVGVHPNDDDEAGEEHLDDPSDPGCPHATRFRSPTVNDESPAGIGYDRDG